MSAYESMQEQPVPKPELEEIPSIVYEHLTRQNKRYRNSDLLYIGEERKTFAVTEICKCLRQSFYEISGVTPDFDMTIHTKYSVEAAWSAQSGKYLHNLTSATSWRELDSERAFYFSDLDNTLFIRGRLDMYDPKEGRVIDLKTTNSVKWQYESGFIPRAKDILQVQCYSTIFSSVIPISRLTLLYSDLKTMISFRVAMIERTSWIRERVWQLYVSLNITKTAPTAEESSSCNYCRFRKRCSSQVE